MPKHISLPRTGLTLLLMVFLVAMLLTSTGMGADKRAPVLGIEGEYVIPDQYLIVFDKDLIEAEARPIIDQLSQMEDVNLEVIFSQVFQGFSAKLSPEALELLRQHPLIAYIEAEQLFHIEDGQQDPPWGLDRIGQRDQPMDDLFTYSATGAGVNVYVLDTGIRISHQEFDGRAQDAFSSIQDGNGFHDCHGHGTHVAGIVGGRTYGVAKSTQLHNVRVMDCEGVGTTSEVISGLEWVIENHVKPAVANLSLGGIPSRALDDAVANAIAAGVTVTLAAGNDGIDA